MRRVSAESQARRKRTARGPRPQGVPTPQRGTLRRFAAAPSASENKLDAVSSSPRAVLVDATENDRYFDYCLQPYEPRRSSRGMLRGETLLWHSLSVADASDAAHDTMRAVQAAAGRDATVFGVKLLGGQLSWELYFYDPRKEDPKVTATAMQQSLAPWLRIDAEVRESLPYFMWSFNVGPGLAVGDVVPELNLYLPEPVGQAGRSYRLAGRQLTFENTYTFLHPKKEIHEVLARLRGCAFVDLTRVDLARLLLPELFSCNRICIARKREADAVYYSGLTVEQLLWFLERFGWPRALGDFAREHRARLEHLRFDVGVDVRMGPDGQVQYPKASYYSTL